MEFLSMLWMPILVSAVIIWLASAIMHMALPFHKGEYKGLPDEAKFNAALEGVAPGFYMFPWCGSMANMKDPDYLAKVEKGPNGFMSIVSGGVNFGKNLMLMLLYYLLVGTFVAYVGWYAMGRGGDYLHVFRVTGAAAFLAYGLGHLPRTIWYRDPGFWAYLFDGIVYALLTAGVFAWLWPRAMAVAV